MLIQSPGYQTNVLHSSSICINRTAAYDINDENEITYEVQFSEEVTNLVQIGEDSSGITAIFQEGNIVDTVKLTSDVRMFLNGKEVIVESIEGPVLNEEIRGGSLISYYAEPRARNSEYRENPYVGVSSDYYLNPVPYRKNSVYAGSLIASLSTGALSSTIAYAFGFSLPGSLAIGAFGTLALLMKPAAERYAPDSAYFSYDVTRYEYGGNNAPTPLDKYYEFTGDYFIKTNCQGYSVPHKFYEHNYFN